MALPMSLLDEALGRIFRLSGRGLLRFSSPQRDFAERIEFIPDINKRAIPAGIMR